MADETRDVTITLDDGTTHTYKGVPKSVTPDQIEQRASKEFSGKKLTNISGGAPSDEEPKGKVTVKGLTEAAFGKGTSEEAPFGERVKKIGETAATAGLLTGAAKMAAPAMITGGERLLGKGPIGTAAGGALIAGGELAKGITPQAIIGATGAGAGGETLEQLASSLGADRPTQVALGMAGAPLGQLATEYPGKVLSGIARTVSKPITSLFEAGFGDLFKNAAEQRASQMRKEATDKAIDELKAGVTKDASATLDKALKGGVAERQKAMESDRLLQEAKAKQEIARRQQLQQQQLQAQQKAIVPMAQDEEQFAGQLQGDIFATQKPLVENRSKRYQELLSQAQESARAKQESGNYWQNTEGGQSVRQFWEDKIANRELRSSEAKEVESILKDIYGDATTPPMDIKGIDSWIRDLGDKANYGKEVEGAKAISATRARELRRSITEGIGKRGEEVGGIYSWEPKFGEAKGLYSEQSELLKAWETKTGRKTLAEETKPLEVPKQYFTSRAGYEDLVKQLGGDEAKAAQYAKQYAQLKTEDLTTSKELNNWLKDPKNGWIDRVPGLRQQIEQKSTAGARAEELGKQIPVLEKNLVDWNKSVDTKAQKLYSDIMGDEKPGMAIENIFLGKKLSDAENRALFTYISKNPEARKLVPSAVKDILSEQSPAKMVEVFDSRIAPVLKSAKLMSDSDIGNIKLQARKIYEADAKDYNIPKDKKTMRALDFVQGAIAGRIASEATPQPQGESNAAY